MTAPAHPRGAEVARRLREAGATGELRVLPAEVRTAAEVGHGPGDGLGAASDVGLRDEAQVCT